MSRGVVSSDITSGSRLADVAASQFGSEVVQMAPFHGPRGECCGWAEWCDGRPANIV
jgi:hypothetical protein